MNAFNPSRTFAERDGEVCLNLPRGSRYVIHVLNEEKAQRPCIDKVAPFRSYMGSLGRTEQLTYAHVECVDGRPRARPREWRGLSRPAEEVFF